MSKFLKWVFSGNFMNAKIQMVDLMILIPQMLEVFNVNILLINVDMI